jgi:hypothetical protein
MGLGFRTIVGVATGLALLFTAWPARARAAERSLLVQRRQTEVKAYGGVAIFSMWDGSAYRLVASRAASAPEALPVPSQDKPFDADIGPDQRGRATVVFSRCSAVSDCDLYMLRLSSGQLVKLRSTNDPRGAEVRPTIWRGRIAWLRRSKLGERVYVRDLRDAGSVRSRALPGVPRGGFVQELELYGRYLAVSTVTNREDAGICGQREVRLVDTSSRRVRLVGSQLCGLNGQSWIGPSFAGGWLYVVRFCAGNPGGCASFGAYRYGLRTGTYQLARFGRNLTGWAYDANGRAYEARDPSGECNRTDIDLPPCSVVRISGLRFSATRPLR